MPSLTIDFSVYCGTCGAGLCNQSDTRKSRSRSEDQITVEVCSDCLEKAKAPLEDKIQDLENKLQEVQDNLDYAERRINEFTTA
jgi:uncharacterized protein YlxW (UPF0749 family)